MSNKKNKKKKFLKELYEDTESEEDEPPTKKQKLTIKDNEIYTKKAKNTNNINKVIRIKVDLVPIYRMKHIKFDKLFVYCMYSKKEQLKNVFDAIQKYLDRKYPQFVMKIQWINPARYDSFVSCGFREDFDNESITKYKKKKIENKGLAINIEGKYKHQIKSENVSCPEMIKQQSLDPMRCSIYKSMKQNYQFNESNLSHLNSFKHFIDDIQEKPECKFNEKCDSFQRLENGGNKISDRCHLKLYRHPPRRRNIKLSQNMHSFIFNKNPNEGLVYKPTKDDKTKYGWNKFDGFLTALVEEVIANGFKSDLCLQCGKNDKCQHSQHSILEVVDQKMEHYRHKTMGKPLNRAEMLALTLYTGCECNYDLCSSQRKGDYKKWLWFDCCLMSAIINLSLREAGDFSVYSGLNGVKIPSKNVKCGYFVTYTSTTWNKKVAESFMGDNGMIIQMDKKFKQKVKCCDVSWFSKFEDEREILFARSTTRNKSSGFNLSVVDECMGIQTVLLEHQEHDENLS